ncbi:MAG: DUF418 domain-containing protein [Bacteroidales bacterium]|nr:DUF418 domain-containing protein [Bacteroidales bacterium]
MTLLITPTASSQRIELLDALRGLAIFGILMVNMPLFFKPVSAMLLGYTGSGNILELFSQLFIKFFFEGKFYVIFSMLFGYGFWLFINRTSPDGKSIIPTFRWRVFYLMLFGIAHIVFLWAGDILLWYAILGFILLLYRKVSDRGIIKWAAWLVIIPTLMIGLFTLLALLAGMDPSAKEAFEAGVKENAAGMQMLHDKAYQVYSNGSYSEIISTRITEYLTLMPGAFFFYPVVLAMFLAGVWAARKGIIKNYHDHLPFFSRLLKWGLIIGIPVSVAYAYAYTQAPMSEPGIWSLLGTAGHTVSGIMLGMAYVSAIVLLTARGSLDKFLSLIAAVGRMALTNYLLHSIICTTLFLPYGFGLFGKIEYWQGILLTIVIFSLQIPFSIFWLKHFNYGPFEWLWRSLTYRKLQPFRKS